MFSRLKVLLIVLLLTLSACSMMNRKTDGVKIENIRPIPTNITIIAKKIDRKVYADTYIGGGNNNHFRMPQIYNKLEAGGQVTEHRFFDIKKNSILHLLGIKNVDVLVAANSYVVPNIDVFWTYLGLLRYENEATIEIRRNGLPVLLRYKFIQY